jgi:hypothetical protein|tara:strand:+ start:98 stop:481 length:384 start_codon:yes stop_codon:yes gene_type:complete
MASTIKIKRSSVLGKAPTTSDIAVGEIAINTRDSKMFSRDTTLGVFEIGANVSSSTIGTLTVGNSSPYTLPITDGAASGILRTNGSGTLTFSGDYVKMANLQSYVANTNPRLTNLESDVLAMAIALG